MKTTFGSERVALSGTPPRGYQGKISLGYY
jgi:hypothetical protein